MTPTNETQRNPGKIMGIKMPVINGAKVTKFIYEYFLGIHEDELRAYEQKLKTKDEAKVKDNERHLVK